jgi:transposase
MSKIRKNYSAGFKSKVALEAIKGELTLAEIATKHSLHQTQINKWKRQALDGLSDVFADNKKKTAISTESQIKDLHAKIGQLLVEKDFLLRASGR